MAKLFGKLEIGSVMSEGQSTARVYGLETRLVYEDNPPVKVAGMTVDGQWREIQLYNKEDLLGGVPNNLYDKQAIQHGYMEHELCHGNGLLVYLFS